MDLAKFMSSATGRTLRVFAGIVIVIIGLLAIHGIIGLSLAIIGLVPIIAGIFNYCVFAPFFGGPFNGKNIKK